MNHEIIAIIALALAAIPALMFLWNLPQLKAPTPHPASGHSMNCSSRRESALTSPRNQMERTHVHCYGVQSEGQSKLAAISVLIPARNEGANIRGVLTSVLENRGVNFEVVVLDDHSVDDTAAIVREFATCDPRVRLENAPPLPAGWCGKQHACHILAQHANHPLLVFVDADVRLAPNALACMSAFMTRGSVLACGGPPPLSNTRQSAKELAHSKTWRNPNFKPFTPALASGVPRQFTGTLLEKLLIPLIHFVLLGFLPVWRMRRCTKPAYGAGCGQLFIARADAYRAAGGHAAIRNSLHDGLKLPRAFRRAGYQTDLFDATDIASCRMYRSAREVVDGLIKNAHEGLAAPAQIGPWTLLLFGGQVLPWILLAVSPWLVGELFQLALVGALLTLLPRALAAWRFRQSWLGVALHPLAVAAFLAIQWRTLFRSFQHQPQTWKGRSYGHGSATAKAQPAPLARSGKQAVAVSVLITVVWALSCLAAIAGTNACARFTLEDQFGTTHDFKFPRDKPTVLTVADKKGSSEIKDWAHPLAEKLGDKIIIAGLADVSSVPGPLRGLVRAEFKKAVTYPVMLDWEGAASRSFNYEKASANVYLISTDGRVLHHIAGKADAAQLRTLIERVEREIAPETQANARSN